MITIPDMKKIVLLALLALYFLPALAQKKKKVRVERSPKQVIQYDNMQYLPSIKTVQLYPQNKENGFPIIDIDAPEQLLLQFDDLRADVRNFYMSIEHCNANWEPSRLSPLEYAYGFNEERIFDFESSRATLQAYTHYEFSFPTENLRPKVPGNYILKIYEDADKDRLIITHRFYAYRNLIPVSTTINPSMEVARRQANQKLDVFLKTGNININNPHQDLKVLVFQNQRPDNQQLLQSPMFVGNNEIRYNNVNTLDFKGNNEFKYIDLRSFRLASEKVRQISKDFLYHITAVTDEAFIPTYANTFDENGNFFIRNIDFPDAHTESDYARVKFSIAARADIQGDIYLVGRFNNFQRKEDNRLKYNDKTQNWEVTLPLKQGLYDYDYIREDQNGEVITDQFSNSFFQTGNDYQVLVYLKRIGTFWEELVGFSENSIHNRQ